MTTQTLIHSVFNPTSVIRTDLGTRLSMSGYGSVQFRWIGSETAPAYTDDREVVVVLVATLRTLKETLEFYWFWAISHHPNHDPLDKFCTNIESIRLWKSKFQPCTLQWIQLKLNKNFAQSPENARRASSYLPGIEVLAALAEHPERARKSNGTRERPYLWMGGVENHIFGFGLWGRLPGLWFFSSVGRLYRPVTWCGYAYANAAVPVVVGCT